MIQTSLSDADEERLPVALGDTGRPPRPEPPTASRGMLAITRTAKPWLVVAAATAALITGCGDDTNGTPDVSDDPVLAQGRELFRQRCSGCHTLSAAGARGTAADPSRRERRDGPNLDRRTVSYDDALFAIRNGGFAGGDRMPANIVVGSDAEAVARFVERFSGRRP